MLPLRVLCSVLQGLWAQRVTAVCRGNLVLCGGISTVPVDENDSCTSPAYAARECTSHAFSATQGSWHHAIKKSGSAHRGSFANPFSAVFLNVLLDFSPEKPVESRQSFHNYVFKHRATREGGYSLSGSVFPWGGEDWAYVMHKRVYATDRQRRWPVKSQSVGSCNGTVVNNAPAALFSNISEKFWSAIRSTSPPKRIAVRFPNPKGQRLENRFLQWG